MKTDSPLADFLHTHSYQLQGEHCVLGDTAVATETTTAIDSFITPLSHYGFLLTAGPDANKFLQGQTTCNLNDVTPDNSRPGAYCTPKGRMVSSFQIASLDAEQYLLRMRRDLVDSTQKAFGKYIVFSKAEQTNVSDEYLAVGLIGASAGTNIATLFDQRPAGQFHSVQHNGNLAIQLDTEGQQFECWLRAEQLPDAWPALSQGLTARGSRCWELYNIRQGLGEVCAATVEEFLPQMLNYQLTGGVNFKKGCYTGQEVVARMHYKATVKRRMFRIMIANTDTQVIAANTPLFRPDSEQSIGNIVNAVALENGCTEALAVITIQDAQAGTVLAGEKRLPVEVLSLPYAITSE